MSAAMHTPGPWHPVPYGDGDDTVICSDVAGNLRIAFMAVPGCRDRQERRKKFAEIKANARLIAAAPELLEALIDIISWFDGGPSPHGPWIIRAGEYGADDAVEAVRTAIAKATGQ